MKKINVMSDLIYGKEMVNDREVISFLGIPYAKAKRFEMPKMMENYQKKPINSGYGVRFPQNDVPPILNFFLKNPMMRKEILTNSDKTDENAFVLNVWTTDIENKKPVLVFIHGGGFTYGSGTTPLYNGKYLASKGIVVVTVNYRLGALGFLPVKINGKMSVNRGFYDQQCALKWIRKNISKFGGDESNITLMGQSAGGLSVSVHMMSEESNKYFDKLIVCSAGINDSISIEQAEKLSENILKQNRVNSMEELQNLSIKKLNKLKMPLAVLSSPVVDGVLLKDNPSEKLEKGSFKSKPVLLGTTEDEMEMINIKSWYKAMGIVNSKEELLKKYSENFGENGAKIVEVLLSKYQDVIKAQFKIMELPFHVSALRELKSYSKNNICYGYRMNFIPNIWNGLRKAYHCAELPYIFGTIQDIDFYITEENLKQMKIIQNDWLEFIKNGKIKNHQSFKENGKISLYENTEIKLIDFPLRELIEDLQDSGIFKKIMKMFMKGRDENFIA